MPMNLKDYRRVLALHRTINDTASAPNEVATALKALMRLLASYGLDEQDRDAVIAKAKEEVDKAEGRGPPPPPPPPPPDPLEEADRLNLLKVLTGLIDYYVAMTEEQRVATALWILYTHLFPRKLYLHAPRLLVTSPVEGCGKSMLMMLLEGLVACPDVADSVTPAAIYRSMQPPEDWPSDEYYPTFLFDEIHNADILRNPLMRKILNAGYLKDRKVKLVMGKTARGISVFTPMALAGIDANHILPLDLLRRCIVLDIQRSARTDLKQPIGDDFAMECALVVERLKRWEVSFPIDPPPPQIPEELGGSARDNWRPLLAIAEHLGAGAEARAAALKLGERGEHNERVILLTHIRDVFARNPTWDRITRERLLSELHNQEDSPWLEWHGLRTADARQPPQPHPLTARELVTALGRFNIKVKNIFAKGGRQTRGPSAKGWYRADFEFAWASYCTKPPPPPSSPPPPPPALPKPRARKRPSSRRRKR